MIFYRIGLGLFWVTCSDQWSKICLDLPGSWCIKGTSESMTRVDSPVPLMHHDPDRSRQILDHWSKLGSPQRNAPLDPWWPISATFSQKAGMNRCQMSKGWPEMQSFASSNTSDGPSLLHNGFIYRSQKTATAYLLWHVQWRHWSSFIPQNCPTRWKHPSVFCLWQGKASPISCHNHPLSWAVCGHTWHQNHRANQPGVGHKAWCSCLVYNQELDIKPDAVA